MTVRSVSLVDMIYLVEVLGTLALQKNVWILEELHCRFENNDEGEGFFWGSQSLDPLFD